MADRSCIADAFAVWDIFCSNQWSTTDSSEVRMTVSCVWIEDELRMMMVGGVRVNERRMKVVSIWIKNRSKYMHPSIYIIYLHTYFYIISTYLHAYLNVRIYIIYTLSHTGWPNELSRCLQNPWIRTLVDSNKLLKTWYLSLPRQALGVIRIWLSISIMWLTEVSGHGAGGLVSQWAAP